MNETKQKRTRKPKTPQEPLLDALKWVSQAQDGSATWANHCRIQDGWAVGFDGAVAAGHRVPVDWYALPHTGRLVAALSRAKEGASIVVDDIALTVESGPLRVRVPVLDVLPELPTADAPSIVIATEYANDSILSAIERVLPCCRESAATILESSIKLADGTATATNRVLLLQAWHGVNMPRMILPRAAASILVKQTGLTGIGASDNAATFWFGPDKWLRFNLYRNEDYPNIDKIFAVQDNPYKLPEAFKEAVAAVSPHVGDDGLLAVDWAYVETTDGTARFQYDNPEKSPGAVKFKADYLKIVAELATEVDFDAGGRMIFYGNNIRGALAHSS